MLKYCTKIFVLLALILLGRHIANSLYINENEIAAFADIQSDTAF